MRCGPAQDPPEKKYPLQNQPCVSHTAAGCLQPGHLRQLCVTVGCLSSSVLCFLVGFWRDEHLCLDQACSCSGRTQLLEAGAAGKQAGAWFLSPVPLMGNLELNCGCLTSIVLEAGLSSLATRVKAAPIPLGRKKLLFVSTPACFSKTCARP